MHPAEFVHRPQVADDKGIALLAALAIVAILAVVIFDYSFSVRVDMHVAANFRDRLVALEAAKAGVNYGIYMLRQDQDTRLDNLQDEWAQPAAIVLNRTSVLDVADLSSLTQEEIDMYKYEDYMSREKEGTVPTATIAIYDEERKINVNFLAGRNANPLCKVWIENLIENLELPDVDPYYLVENITDWIDDDDDGQAEQLYYESLPEPYSCRNGPIESIYELKLVKGMTDLVFFGDTPYPLQLSGLEEDEWEERQRLGYTLPETPPWEREEDPYAIYGLINFLTTRSSGRVNFNTAPREVLKAILGNDDSMVDMLLELREETPIQAKEIEMVLGADLYKMLTPSITLQSSYFRIESTGKFHKASVKAISIVSRSSARDIVTYYWRVEDVKPESSTEDVPWVNVM
jgi:type II secretory pathway component PulK